MADGVQQGDLVKANFRPIPGNRDWDAERMWVKVLSVDSEVLHGALENEPFDIPQLRAGAPVCVPRTHIIDVIWGDGHDGPEDPPHRDYWERCFVDACVVDGRSHVDYFYRENPDMTAEGDKYPDSGWRFRGTPEAIEDDDANERSPEYIAIGKVLNADDRWLHLIDELMGWAYQWSVAEQDYIRSEHI